MILVTGASGFIGHALCETLVREGGRVRAAVRRKTSTLDNVDQVETGGLGKGADLDRLLDGVRSVVHLAARVHRMEDTEAEAEAAYRETNTLLTQRLAEAALNAGVERMVFISTVKVFGDTLHGPAEDPQPDDPYGRSKWEAEKQLQALFEKQLKAACVTLRLPLVYGPGNKGNMIPLLRAAMRNLPLPLGCACGPRSLVFVGNVCSAIVTVLKDTPESPFLYRAYTIHDAEDLTSSELYSLLVTACGHRPRLLNIPEGLMRAAGSLGSLVQSITGKKIPLNRSVVSRLFDSYCVSMEPFCRDFGWSPPYTSKEGIEQTVNWFKQEVRV